MKIGIFDSGIGGLSVLYEAMQLLPHEQFIYYADEKHVPYGEKTREEIIGYVDEIIQFMIDHDCKAIVIACNTATSAAVALMRKKYDIPIIGMEPAVKKAVDAEMIAVGGFGINAKVISRIKEAQKYISLDRLCLSPQCGFASCEIGNKLTEEEQWAKLQLVKEIAEEVWR